MKKMNLKPHLFVILFSLVFFLGSGVAIGDSTETKADAKVSENADTAKDLDPEAFQMGYKLFDRKFYSLAAPLFFNYLQNHSRDDTDYEWADFFFGICLKKMGLSHASVDTLAHLVTRKPNPKIVSYCLELFEETTRTIPFDRDLVINKVICDQEYGFVDAELGDFIHFHQGRYDWEHGFFQWGNDHFNQIQPKTLYFYKYQYQKALYRIYRGEADSAILILEEILDGPCREEKLKDDARKTLARLLYEKELFEDADALYEEIQQNILEQSQNLLERAWVHYRMGHPEKAMGFLYAFEAPSFKNHFTPEYYILKSFIFKDVCHYQHAMTVVSGFKERYGTALDSIYHRGKPEENYPLMLVLLGKDKIRDTWKFLELLEKEKSLCLELEDKALSLYLENMYALQIQESTDILKKQINEEYEKIANQLLKYEEEAYLMEYEIGLDMYQRIYDFHFEGERTTEKAPSDRMVVYPFQGEFWNDELADYHVTLPNKCENLEEWDIFFK